LPESPTAAIDWLPEVTTRNGVITDLVAWSAAVEEVNNPIHRAAYLLGLYSGMRLTEVLTLEWARVYDDRIHIPVNKSRRDFWLPITGAHHRILEPLRAIDDRWVFPSPKARDGHVVALERVGWTFHSLRHTFASIGVEVGHLEETVGRLLNHSVGGITSRYVKVDCEALRPVMQSIVDEITRRLNGTRRLNSSRQLE
jgi:integrase